MSGTDHKRWSEDLAAYALGALEPEQTAALERHLEECERCRTELRRLGPATAALSESVERVEPPPQLRARLMAEVEADARPAPTPRRSRWLLRPAVGFAVLALLVAGVVGYELGGDGSGRGGERTVVRQAGEITVKMIREGDGGTLQLSNMPELPPDKVLEAWVERAGKVEAVPALFVPDRHGRAQTTIADMSGVETVMVTEEPRGGSEQPTSDPLVTMSVPG